ncbi:Uncharacterised protein [Proteus vulgaris]|nr:Uncharacterised protein [Proteus vulgaris]
MSEIQQVIFDGMILYDKEAAKITNLLDTKKSRNIDCTCK